MRRRAVIGGTIGAIVLLGLLLVSRAVNLRIVHFVPGQGPAKVTLTYVCWGDVTEQELNKHWVDEFAKQNADLTINTVNTPGGQSTEDKITTMIAGGSAPDVMYVWPEVFPTFVRKGIYAPLDPYMQRDGVQRQAWFHALIDFYTTDGHVYGLPRSWHPYVLFYNKRLFDEAGVPYPKASWTWDTVVREGRRLTKDRDGDGAVDQYAIGNVPWEIFVWGEGGRTFDREGRCYLDEPAAVRGLQLYRDLIWKWRIMPSPQELQQTQSPQEMFETGRLAMFALGIWSVPAFRQLQEFKWDIAPMPAGRVRKVTQLVTAGWGVSAQSRNADAAWRLVKYLSGPEAQAYQMKIWRDPSGLRDVFKGLMFFEPEKPPASRQVLLDSIAFGQFATPFEGQVEVYDQLTKTIEELTSGRAEDMQALGTRIREESDRILADYRRRNAGQ